MTVHYVDLFERSKGKTGSEPADSTKRDGREIYSAALKRPLDIILILIALPIVVPVIAILSILIAIDGSRPLYRQKRLGLNGRSFTMWKLRTMIPDADEKLQRHLENDIAAKGEWESTQKLKQDPRITALGRVLRKTSLDELPQLWNVLRGDMSLIGPRPMLPEQEKLYPGPAYHGMRPGITGLWQVSDRNDCSFAERASYDLHYSRRISFVTDLRILARTVRVVLRCTGY